MVTHTIEGVRLAHVRIPLKEPFRISHGEVCEKDGIVVRLETGDGIVGWGESSPMAAGFGYSSDTPAGCWRELVSRIGPGMLGRSFEGPGDIAAIASSWADCSRFSVAGVETALWDIVAKGRGESLATTLGATAERIAGGVESGLAVGLYPTVIELLRTIEAHLEAGYKRVKIKIAPGRDVELVRAVRQHFAEMPLMVDANAAYDSSHFGIFEEMDDHGLTMFEQPFAIDDIDGMVALQSRLRTPICIDESADTLERAAEAIDRGACRIVNIKIQRVGGFGPALALHEACAARGVPCWVGTMPELGVGQAQGIHLAALSNIRFPTDVEPSARWFVDDYVEPALELAEPGLFRAPEGSGLGYRIDESKIDRFKTAGAELRRRPGSGTKSEATLQ